MNIVDSLEEGKKTWVGNFHGAMGTLKVAKCGINYRQIYKYSVVINGRLAHPF